MSLLAAMHAHTLHGLPALLVVLVILGVFISGIVAVARAMKRGARRLAGRDRA